MSRVYDLFLSLYVYCTDFCISAANLTGLSYYEVNFILFCVAYPLLGVAAALLYRRQKARLKKRTQGS